MLGYNLTMEVDENFSVGAHHPLILIISIELSTVYTSVEERRALILTIRGINKTLKFLHE